MKKAQKIYFNQINNTYLLRYTIYKELKQKLTLTLIEICLINVEFQKEKIIQQLYVNVLLENVENDKL